MKITSYLKNDTSIFSGNIDGKEFSFTVEEFINLIGAFQNTIAQVQGIEISDDDVITTNNIE